MSWKNGLEELLRYVEENPVIEITRNSMVIPEDVRSGFYSLFDGIRADFIREKLAPQLADAYTLSANWDGAVHRLIDRYDIKGVKVTGGLQWFLHDPLDGLMRSIFDTLFDLLKQKIDLAGFEGTALENLLRDFEAHFETGYKRWGVVEMIGMAAPASVYTVPARDFYTDPTLSEGDIGPGLHEETVPAPEQTDEISFEQALLCSFLTPRIILKTGERYIAFRPGFYEARWKARRRTPDQEWLDIEAIQKDFGRSRIWPDLALYASEKLANLELVADYYFVARPDVVVDFRDKPGWSEKEGLAVIKRHYDVLRPKKGSFVFSRHPVPAGALAELETINSEISTSASAGDVSAGVDQTIPAIRLVVSRDSGEEFRPVFKELLGGVHDL